MKLALDELVQNLYEIPKVGDVLTVISSYEVIYCVIICV